ncbi:MAG TPA: ATP-binding protein [bacterium]|nr:ATP-binding protein [bacterium]HOL34516.1 ATP-binding protein [bacterium]HPP08072.1 ATP-binding protein [bacterium]
MKKNIKISVASGKGGTGKTLVSVSLALSINNVQFIDCDVEEPNAHIFLKPEIEIEKSVGIPVPEIDKNKCSLCGECGKICEYHAIVNLKRDVLVFYELCHGCGGCSIVCPEKAIKEKEREIGILRKGKFNGDNEFIDGILNPGEPLSPPLIRNLKKEIKNDKTVIIDCPPGTSCPVVESIKGTDFCILITEPTPFGLNDLTLAVEVLKKLKIPYGVIINKCDSKYNEVEKFCKKENIGILMKIPYKRDIGVAYSKGKSLIEASPQYKKEFQDLLNRIVKIV